MKKLELEEKISESIEYAKKELGFVLVSEDWGNKSGKCACALGCVLIKNNVALDSNTNEEVAAKLLGVDNEWVQAFIAGFDESPWQFDETSTNVKTLREANEIGINIRKHFEPMRYDRYADSFVEDDE